MAEDQELIRRAMSLLGRRSAAKQTPKQRAKRIEKAKRGMRSWWAKLTPEQRSAEMKRRAKVREKNRARKRKPKT